MPFLPEKTVAQMVTAPYAYPKRFRLTALVELTYRDYSTTSSYYGRKTESGWTGFEQRYRLGLQGYVYHPKLFSFSTSVTYRKEKTDDESGEERNAKNINYNFSGSFLPTRPMSLDIYGLKTDYTTEGWGTAPYNITSNFYGARFRFTSMKYPNIRIEYNHWDYTIERERGYAVFYDTYDYDYYEKPFIIIKERVKEKTDIDRFSINLNGFLKAINTRYNLTGDLSDYTSPFRSYKGKNLAINTYTTVKKENTIYTSFQYSDIDITKLTRFTTNLRLFPIGRLQHSYDYEYFTSETEGEKTDSHTVGNYLSYRFSRMTFATAQLHYRFGKRDGVSEDSYDVNIGLNYGKPIKDYDFTSYYKFSLSKNERYGEYKFMENSLGIGLSTRKFTWGRIYLNYDISLREFDFSYLSAFENSDMLSEKAYAIEHRVRAGINGKGPGRAYWNIEAESRIFDSELNDHTTAFWLGEEQWAEKIRHYTLTGDIGYPIGQRILTILKASYTTGQTNSERVERYYYEGRINYRILRNLNLLAWWREDWRNKGWWAGKAMIESRRRQYGWKTREYRLELYYLLRRITISLEYNAYRLEEGPLSSEFKRLCVKLSKPF
jgi:hypothetical protein